MIYHLIQYPLSPNVLAPFQSKIKLQNLVRGHPKDNEFNINHPKGN